jgi:hypothetical protein
MSVGLGAAFKPGTPALEIAKSVARDARTYRDAILEGTMIQLWTEGDGTDNTLPANLMVLYHDHGFFVLTGPTGTHKLSVTYTDAARLQAHVEGFVEIAVSEIARPKEVIRVSIQF